MNYITEINSFYDWLETNRLSKSAIALWNALMHINNKAGWIEVFEVAISTLEFKTGFKKSELCDARNLLVQKGRIEFYKGRGNQSASYKIIPFCVHNMDTNNYASADTNHYANPTQVRNTNKQNKTKLKDDCNSNELLRETSQPHTENIDYKKLIEFFNHETKDVFGTVRYPLSEQRRKRISARIKEHGKESFSEVIKKAAASDFLKNSPFCSFDWLIRPTNFEKTLSGNYDNKENKRIYSSEISSESLRKNIAEGLARGLHEKQRRSI